MGEKTKNKKKTSLDESCKNALTLKNKLAKDVDGFLSSVEIGNNNKINFRGRIGDVYTDIQKLRVLSTASYLLNIAEPYDVVINIASSKNIKNLLRKVEGLNSIAKSMENFSSRAVKNGKYDDLKKVTEYGDSFTNEIKEIETRIAEIINIGLKNGFGDKKEIEKYKKLEAAKKAEEEASEEEARVSKLLTDMEVLKDGKSNLKSLTEELNLSEDDVDLILENLEKDYIEANKTKIKKALSGAKTLSDIVEEYGLKNKATLIPTIDKWLETEKAFATKYLDKFVQELDDYKKKEFKNDSKTKSTKKNLTKVFERLDALIKT